MMTARLRMLLLTAAPLLALVGSAPAAPDAGKPSDKQLKEQALALNKLTDTDAMQDKLTALLKDQAATKKLVQVAAAMQKENPKDSPFNVNAAIILAKAAHNVKNYDAAERFYELAANESSKLKNSQKMLLAFEGWLEFYLDRKKYQNAEEVARKAIDTKGGKEFENAKPFFLEKLVQAKAKQGDTDEALRMAEGLVQLDKGGWYFLQLKGWVQREAGKTEEAISTYKDVLEKLDESKLKADTKTLMKKNVQYLLTGLYVEENKIDQAAEILQKLMKEDPDNPTYYNDLGFVWADHGKKLDESEKLVRKALDLDAKEREKKLADLKKKDKLTPAVAEQLKKENAAYLDSLGWVLFKQKKYKEALPYLQKAAKDDNEGQHIEIWDHLGDVLAALGKKQEAVDVWKKALRFEDVSPRDKDRRKKVTQKLNKMRDELEK
jgi:tetratricopeptide (TPR) repeat protein